MEKKKILLAVDGTKQGSNALSVLGKVLKDCEDVQLVLLHCVQQLARLLPGELCIEVEQTCNLAIDEQEKIGNAVMQESRRLLMEAGVPADRIEVNLKLDSMDPAQDILTWAEAERIQTIALGRHGRSQLETLLLGSVSGKVAQYARHRTVWIVDAPIHESRKVLVALEGSADSRALTHYTAEFLAPISGLQYTFFHLMPPVPPTFWDDGHILAPSEHKDRQSRIERWRADWTQRVQGYMNEGRRALVTRGVSEDKVETIIQPTKEGIARDLLNQIAGSQYEIVVMGKRSFLERKPFLMGSHANKVLQNVKGAILCLVDT